MNRRTCSILLQTLKLNQELVINSRTCVIYSCSAFMVSVPEAALVKGSNKALYSPTGPDFWGDKGHAVTRIYQPGFQPVYLVELICCRAAPLPG